MEAQMWKNAGWTKPATQGTNVLRHVSLDLIRVEVRNGNLEIVGTAQRLQAAVISFEAFEQLAEALDAPASYLRTLGPTLVAQNLNHRLKGAIGTVDLHTDVDGAVVVLSKVEHEKEGAS